MHKCLTILNTNRNLLTGKQCMVSSMDKNMKTKPKAGASESKQSGYKISSDGDNIPKYFTEAVCST